MEQDQPESSNTQLVQPTQTPESTPVQEPQVPATPEVTLSAPPTPTSTPTEPKTMGKFLIIGLVVLVLLLLGGGGYLGYQKWYAPQTQPTNYEECAKFPDSTILLSYPGVCVTKSGQRFTQTVSPIETPDLTADWQTYTNTKYGYSIKFPAHLKTQVQAAGAGEQEASADSNQLFVYDPSTAEPYLERYLEIVALGLVTDLPPGQWQTSEVIINGIPATKIEDPDPKTNIVYSFALPSNTGVLEIYVTKDQQRVTLANQILSTFKFID